MRPAKLLDIPLERVSRAYGLYLLFEGLPSNVIESQVLSHARQMNHEGILMEVWTFACTIEGYREAQYLLPKYVADHEVKITLFRGVRPAFPFSRHLNAFILFFHLIKSRKIPMFVHARTEYTSAVAALLKPIFHFKLVWDARGDTLSEFRERLTKMHFVARLISQLKIEAIKNWIRVASRSCDHAIFVSEELRKVQGINLDMRKSLIVPCLADEHLFYFNSELRSKSRKSMGFSDDDIVMIYSGSDAPWQCVSQTISLMSQAIKINRRYRGLIVTTQPDAFKKYISDELMDRFIVTTATLKEVNGYLNAADIAFLIREVNPINWVASPVKFAEYSMTGLIVVTENAVEQVEYYGRCILNTIGIVKFLSIVSESPEIFLLGRLKRAKDSSDTFARKCYTKDFLPLYFDECSTKSLDKCR